MDGCHILLAQPWLFDRRVIHDGYRNTYTFTKNNKKITLIPVTLTEKSKPNTTHSLEPPIALTTLLTAKHQEVNAQKDLILTNSDEEENPRTEPNHPLLTPLL